MNPLVVGSKIYPTSDRGRFIKVLTAVRRVQAHSIMYGQSYSDGISRYKYRTLHSSTKQDQNRASNHDDSTFNIGYVEENSF